MGVYYLPSWYSVLYQTPVDLNLRSVWSQIGQGKHLLHLRQRSVFQGDVITPSSLVVHLDMGGNKKQLLFWVVFLLIQGRAHFPVCLWKPSWVLPYQHHSFPHQHSINYDHIQDNNPSPHSRGSLGLGEWERIKQVPSMVVIHLGTFLWTLPLSVQAIHSLTNVLSSSI